MIMMEPSNNFFNRKISNGKLLCNFQICGRTTQYRNNSFNKQPLFSGDDALTEFPGHTQKCILCLLTILLRAIASNLHFVVIFITAIAKDLFVFLTGSDRKGTIIFDHIKNKQENLLPSVSTCLPQLSLLECNSLTDDYGVFKEKMNLARAVLGSVGIGNLWSFIMTIYWTAWITGSDVNLFTKWWNDTEDSFVDVTKNVLVYRQQKLKVDSNELRTDLCSTLL